MRNAHTLVIEDEERIRHTFGSFLAGERPGADPRPGNTFVVCPGDTTGRQDLSPETRRFESPPDAPGKTASHDWETILQALQRRGHEKWSVPPPRWISRQIVNRKMREYG